MAPCDYLEWDSNFFGFRIAQYREHLLSEDSWRSAELWCREQNIDCLYLLADSSDPQTASVAQAHSFRFVDTRVLLEAQTSPHTEPPAGVRPAQPEDIETLRRIARSSHYGSRFFFDSRFPRSRAEDLYAAWIQRSLDGWAHAVLVTESDGGVVGYITCHLSDTQGSIGLLAVDQSHRGRGRGRQMLAAAMHLFQHSGMRTVLVVTQARNIASQRLYQQAGFRTRSVQVWFHRWFDKSTPGG
jgi:ribosomal protein S18 acetylase RimI-like enzyme